MTPEERFRNMENLLSALLDSHVRFHEDMEEMKEVQRKLIEAQSRNDVAIRDLILVSRSVVDSQRVTEEKLNALIETVDRIIRDRNR